MSRLTFQLTVALTATLLAFAPVACSSGGTGSAFGASGSGGRQGEAGPGGGQGGAANEAPICKTYLSCVAEVNPAGLAAVLAAYGKTGSCWAQGDAGFCEKACMTGIVALNQNGPGSAACNRCATSADCPSSIPACDTASQRCVECLADSDCGSAKPACDLSTHTCVACTANWQCASPDKPRCDVASQTCVGCLVASDCPAQVCDASAKVCRDCQNDAECPAAKPHCDTTSSVLVQCVQCTSGQQCSTGFCSMEDDCCSSDKDVCANNGIECGRTFDLDPVSACYQREVQCGDCTSGKLCVDGKCKPPPVNNCDPNACASRKCGYIPAQNSYQCVSVYSNCNAAHTRCLDPGYYCYTEQIPDGEYSGCSQYCVTQADCSFGQCMPLNGPTSYGTCE